MWITCQNLQGEAKELRQGYTCWVSAVNGLPPREEPVLTQNPLTDIMTFTA